MPWIDYFLIAVMAVSTLVSVTRGFVKEAVSLVIWLTAFFVASHFYKDLATYFTQIQDLLLRNAAAIAALFVSTLIVGAIVNYLLGQLVDKTGLTGTDRVLGLVFGALRGVLICSALLFFSDAFTPANTTDWWKASKLIPEFSFMIQWFFDYLQTNSEFLQKSV